MKHAASVEVNNVGVVAAVDSLAPMHLVVAPALGPGCLYVYTRKGATNASATHGGAAS